MLRERLDFRFFLESCLRSSPRRIRGEERGLVSRTAAGNRAYVKREGFEGFLFPACLYVNDLILLNLFLAIVFRGISALSHRFIQDLVTNRFGSFTVWPARSTALRTTSTAETTQAMGPGTIN